MQGALRSDGDPAIGVLADYARREPTGSARRALVVDDGGRAVADALAEGGVAVATWRRHAVGADPGAPFPPEGRFDRVVLRLPRGRETLAMLASWLAPRVAEGGELWVAGRNDEGIRSAASTLEEAFASAETRDTRRHCRVLVATGPRFDARGDPEAWLAAHHDEGESWVSWPGSFAHGRIDPGTRLLISALPHLAAGRGPFERALDLGCGAGLVARAIGRLWPAAQLVGLDADALALEAARRNVPGMALRCADAAATLGGGTFDLIASNPPVHQGSSFDPDLTLAVLRRALAALAPGGVLAAVALRGVPLGDALRGDRAVTVAAEDSRYRVWVAR